MEGRTQELFDHRNKLSTQVNELQAILRKKKEQRTEERARLHLRQQQLKGRREELDAKEREVQELKQKLKEVEEKVNGGKAKDPLLLSKNDDGEI